tara:strand:+ start:2342 stop:2803 length:462 start_codon:yes stop_codon:yes gene_type:complete
MAAVLSVHAIPAVLNYAGQVAVNGQAFDGQGLFKFALVNADGNCSVWGYLDLMELPGYYEYLPEFHLIGKDEVAEDIYLNLVKGDDETGLVTGGKTYRNDSLKDIAKLPVGEKEVTFKFRKDSKVKQIKQKFNLPDTGDVFLSFKVKLIPSQG